MSGPSGCCSSTGATATNSTGSGVYGQNDGAGYGVAGRTNSGRGVLADSNGTSLAVNGKSGVDQWLGCRHLAAGWSRP